MPLHIEHIADDLKNFLQVNLRAQLDVALNEHSHTIPISTPRHDQYFVGERNQFIPYTAPACFIIPSSTTETTGSREGENLLKFEHTIFLSFLLEGTDAELLNRATYRLVQAATQCLRDMDITPNGITKRATVVHIPTIDYGRAFVSSAQKMFRRESWITLKIDHWDQRTTLPIEAGTGTQTVVVGTIGTGTTTVASTTETTLTTTAATVVTVYTVGSDSGNFVVHVYLRVSVAPTSLTVTITYTDATGSQTILVMDGTQQTGSYIITPDFFNANGGSTIQVTATAGTANQVAISAVIEQL